MSGFLSRNDSQSDSRNDSPKANIEWRGPKIHVIGLGVGDKAGPQLNQAAVLAIKNAQWLMGADHQLDKVSGFPSDAQTLPYTSPFSDLKNWLMAHQEERIVLLGSGDPLFFGLGSWLIKTLGAQNLTFHTNVSSVQAACAAIGLPHQNVETISLHGRPLKTIHARLKRHQHFAILTDQYSHPKAITQELIRAGYDQSKLWVCEDLGGEHQRVTEFALDEPMIDSLLDEFTAHPLHVTIVHCLSSDTASQQPEFPGLPDTAFETGKAAGKGLITKREIRLAALSYLSPKAGEIAWDIGAGCGSIAIEWARWNPLGQIYAIEHHHERLTHCQTNQQRFGVLNNMTIIEGSAPESCADLPAPDAVFIGGSGGKLNEILNLSFERLNVHGRIVITAVTEPTKSELHQSVAGLPNNVEIHWSQISISKGDEIAGQLLLRPQLPVLIAQIKKLPISSNTTTTS